MTPDFILSASAVTSKRANTHAKGVAFEAILQRWPQFAPEEYAFNDQMRMPLELRNSVEQLKVWDSENSESGHMVILRRRKRPAGRIIIGLYRGSKRVIKGQTFSMRFKYREIKGMHLIGEFVQFFGELVSWFEGRYGLVTLTGGSLDRSRTQDPGVVQAFGGQVPSSAAIAPEAPLPGLFWLNVFGREYITWFGRDKLKTVPGVKLHEDSSELIWMQICESPEDVFSAEAEALKRQVKVHLCERAFWNAEKLRDYDYALPELDVSELTTD